MVNMEILNIIGLIIAITIVAFLVSIVSFGLSIIIGHAAYRVIKTVIKLIKSRR